MNSTRMKYLGAVLAGAALMAGANGLFGLKEAKPGDVVLSQVTIRPRYYPGTPLPDGGTFTDVRVQYEVCGQEVGRGDAGLLEAACTEYIVDAGSSDEKLGASVLQLKSAKDAVKAATRRR